MSKRSGTRTYKAALVFAALAQTAFAADKAPRLISGTIHLPAALATSLGPGDRLVIKSFHPGPDGLEMDPRYRIFTTFEFPYNYRIGPLSDMAGRTKHTMYKVEAFTDKDNNLESIVPGELRVVSEDLLPLGTGNVRLELSPRQQ